MTSNHVKTTLMGKHKINKVKVEIYFAPNHSLLLSSYMILTSIDKLIYKNRMLMSQQISQMYYEDIMWLFYGCCMWNLIVDWEIK